MLGRVTRRGCEEGTDDARGPSAGVVGRSRPWYVTGAKGECDPSALARVTSVVVEEMSR